MNDLKLTYSPFTLYLKKSFDNSKGKITKRKGFILFLEDPDGIKGVGECAPLPEFGLPAGKAGSEKYEDAERVLKNIRLNLKINLDSLEKSLTKNLSPYNKCPSLKHGLEQAILNLICNEKKLSIENLFNKKAKDFVNVNGIIGLVSMKAAISETQKLIDKGFSTIKIKLGREKFSDDLKIINEIRKAGGNNIKLRADVNGKWKLNEAKKIIPQLEEYNLEYLEQPVRRINDMIKLNRISPVPIAADESCRSFDDCKQIILKKAAPVLILKPMLVGGIVPSLQIIEFAKRKKIKVIVTTSLESAIGRSSAVFVSALIEDDAAHGLGTGELFKKDLIADPFPVKNGKIYLRNLN
jgi:o-succinylbenzoate synthase